ncbi:trimeric intracellular cation channel family protein [Anaeromicropila herbilytica]|uniref:UPF0126 membrane protein YvgT n=1 Tax=Anaeromicropila herbilytica TaxID=2785025 RepID=A0A7R7ICP5_9FIRM|nr:trimeric intracellular cation channel family protein [Anaeromicropila herbilytica]BCN30154.1 UPF0126 membrane protein YvgT [Anaeromicropila herbilytica]
MNGITLLEYVGVFAFAISGASIAMREDFDLLGIYILGMVTAMGGGIIRDIVTQQGIPIFFTSYGAILVIFIATTLAIFLRGKWDDHMLFVTVDAIGLAAFVVSSGIKAIDNHYNLVLFIFVTSITGVGGGLLRDIFARRKPMIFQSDIYCIAGIIGALVLKGAYPFLGKSLSVYLSLIVIVTIRMFCYLKNINLPKVKHFSSKTESQVNF